MHLKKFPLDSQLCPLEIGSCKYSLCRKRTPSLIHDCTVSEINSYHRRWDLSRQMWSQLGVVSRVATSKYSWTCTGGVSYTVGGAAAPPTSWFAPPTMYFATPTFGRYGGFLALKQWFLTLTMQICHICRHSAFSFLFVYLSTAEHPVNDPFFPTNFFWKAPPMAGCGGHEV